MTDGRGKGASVERAERGERRPKAEFFAGLALLLVALAVGYHWRPRREEPWNGQAIMARFIDVTVQKSEKDVHLIFTYALTNTTGHGYRLPPPSQGVLMTRVSEPASQDAEAALHEPEPGMKQVDSVIWNPQLVISPHKTVNAEFDVSVDPTAYGTSLDELHDQKDLAAFSKLRLKELRQFVFLDYAKRYVIMLPRGWE